ncbi:MAG TPA: ferritin-like domain-containing protein [Burkholderiales bacterium]|nr:ferritin-like domain-containing protein [Burkholderiales bacterium]
MQSSTKQPQQSATSVLTNVETIRQRARQDIEAGAVTPSYNANREEVIRLLNEALATEIVCYLRYKRHYFVADGIHAEPVAAEFLEHATQEQEHADQIAGRIVQLGGSPDFSPDGLASRSHAQYVEGGSLADMIRENLIAERIAIESYREIAQYLGDKDPTTRRLMEQILATEEEHANDLVGLMHGLKEEGA